jgi:hypothetical protein
MKHKVWDKLGQWDPNTFSRIEAQIQSTFERPPWGTTIGKLLEVGPLVNSSYLQ